MTWYRLLYFKALTGKQLPSPLYPSEYKPYEAKMNKGCGLIVYNAKHVTVHARKYNTDHSYFKARTHVTTISTFTKCCAIPHEALNGFEHFSQAEVLKTH